MRKAYSCLILPVMVLAACGQRHYRSAEDAAHSPEQQAVAAADSTDFSSDISALNSPSRKRVRTADVRCRVQDVFRAASRLEQTVTAVQGIVVESRMKNEAVQQHELPYTSDSVRQVQLYTPTASLTLRVPVGHLDSVVHTLTSMAAFIEYRTLTDQDYTWNYLSNSLKNDKLAPVKKIKPDAGTSSLDIAKFEEEQHEKSVDRSISNMQLLDNVAYSTFTVQLFQPEVADVQVVVNPQQFKRAPFGTEVRTALRDGAVMMRNILLGMLQVWPFWIAVAAGIAAYRRYFAKSR
ncbi:DUF4349 domain-containing protein [Chitinophaga solisilvae]|uniref:DUF4349 domain-containing protein n=1 Tax=Chitinophaga solisilvae TaxID=1233460 RepID=UPI00136D3EC5|nr:DUF4349 domain-containing protein [Chitinophaga solisilvae]